MLSLVCPRTAPGHLNRFAITNRSRAVESNICGGDNGHSLVKLDIPIVAFFQQEAVVSACSEGHCPKLRVPCNLCGWPDGCISGDGYGFDGQVGLAIHDRARLPEFAAEQVQSLAAIGVHVRKVSNDRKAARAIKTERRNAGD